MTLFTVRDVLDALECLHKGDCCKGPKCPFYGTDCDRRVALKASQIIEGLKRGNGKWEDVPSFPERSPIFRCSSCGNEAYCVQSVAAKKFHRHCHYKFCPNCGAKMEG